MKTALAVALTALVAASIAWGQSSNRYGGGASLPADLAEIESAFSTSQPSTPSPARRSRYGNGGVPSLPPSTPITARGEQPKPPQNRPSQNRSAQNRLTPPRPRAATASPTPAPRPQQPNPLRQSQPTQSRATQQLPTQRRIQQPNRFQQGGRFQPSNAQSSTGVTIPEGPSHLTPPSQSRGSTFDRSVVRTSNPESDNAQRIMADMLKPRSGSQLQGTPVTVADVTRGAPTRDQQSHRVEAYWDLCASVADYYLGLKEADNLARLRQSMPGMSQPLQRAEQAIRNRLDTSLRAAVAGQHRVASMMGVPGSLPLPADSPFCGVYRTEYDRIFNGRSTSSATVAEARQLHELLPLRHAELLRRAQAVEDSEKFVNKVASRTRNSDGTAMIQALELVALNRRAFVQIAKDYNRRIARYTELSTPGRVDTNLLVAMLVGSSDRVSISSGVSLR